MISVKHMMNVLNFSHASARTYYFISFVNFFVTFSIAQTTITKNLKIGMIV